MGDLASRAVAREDARAGIIQLMADAASVLLLTSEPGPGDRVLGLVRFWGQDRQLVRAEQLAFDGVREHALALGADTVVAFRVEVQQDLRIASDGPLLPKISFLKTESTWLVYAYGTAVLRGS